MTHDDNYMLISLDDEKSKAIAEVISSKTCRKIINYLSEHKEASQKDISDALNIPLNTLEYNIKKLLKSGFIQKTKNFFWSKKGKKIIMYKLSRKSVIISHKKSVSNKIKSILPAFIITGAGTFAIWVYEKIFYSNDLVFSETAKIQDSLAYETVRAGQNIVSSEPNLWAWFLIGSLISLLIISVINWRKL